MADRKQLIREYKEAGTPMGVYRVRNLRNGKSFVGSARAASSMASWHN